ncbi:hypothetical protein RIR_e15273_A0A2N1NV78_9GLOM [Rhizophagus irregularis DAOM 181602=DAOM 197198]|nr:hypothetical protein RIR_e15273_A0A2N1NV78_9GLOM [Rhizophagus irregularis DAOM 181602=DAOM 197198]
MLVFVILILIHDLILTIFQFYFHFSNKIYVINSESPLFAETIEISNKISPSHCRVVYLKRNLF